MLFLAVPPHIQQFFLCHQFAVGAVQLGVMFHGVAYTCGRLGVEFVVDQCFDIHVCDPVGHYGLYLYRCVRRFVSVL